MIPGSAVRLKRDVLIFRSFKRTLSVNVSRMLSTTSLGTSHPFPGASVQRPRENEKLISRVFVLYLAPNGEKGTGTGCPSILSTSALVDLKGTIPLYSLD